MAIALSTNFLLGSGLPLDGRTVVADTTARDLIPPIQRYDGLIVYTTTGAINYQLQGGITNPDWVELVGAGVTLVSDILYWDSGNNKYTPYVTQTSGSFDSDSVDPVHTTRLNYDGYFYATKLSSKYLFVPDGSSPTLTISAGNASGVVGTGAGDLILKAGYPLAGDATSHQGNVYIVPGNNYASSQAGYIYLGDASSNFMAIFLQAAGAVPNVDIDIQAKGTGEVSLWAGNDITLTAVNGIKAQLDLFSLGYGGLTDSTFTAYNTTSGQKGVNLTVKAGSVTGGGNWNGGDLFLYGGLPQGSGTLGKIYFGTGAAGKLSAKTAETNIVYYNTTTGLLSYGTIISSMVYPGAGIAKSTGSAWDTSYTTSGTGTVVTLATAPTLLAPITIITVDTTVNPAIKFRATSNNAYGLDFDQEESSAGYLALYSVRNNVRTLGLVQSWSATSNARIGIGTTTPQTYLHVSYTSSVTPLIYFGNNAGSGGYGHLGWDSGGSTIGWIGTTYNDNAARFDIRMKGTAAANAVVSVLGSGFVGIGTTTPARSLVVSNGGANGVEIDVTAATTYTHIFGYNRSGGANTDLAFNVYGNVGIGTVTPAVKLDINGSLNISGAGLSAPPVGLAYGLFPHSGVGLGIYSTAGSISFWGAGTPVERMRLTATGLGIGTSPSTKLHVAGNVQLFDPAQDPSNHSYITTVASSVNTQTLILGTTYGYGSEITAISMYNGVVTFPHLASGSLTSASGVITSSSDQTLKTSDGYIDTALDKVMQLTPRYFYWNEKSGFDLNTQKIRQLGFYAQEVNKVLGEEVANTPEEGKTWGIYDRGIIAMLVKAMQEQQVQIDALKKKK